MKAKILNIIIGFLLSIFMLSSILILKKSNFNIFISPYSDLKVIFYLSLLSILILTITLFFRNLTKLYILIIFISSILSIYLYEFYLVKFELRYQSELKKNFQIKFKNPDHDWRTKYQVYVDEIDKGNDIALKYIPSFFLNKEEEFALVGLSNSKTILCNESGYYATFISDRYGFNNIDSKWDKFKKKSDWALLGDSAAIGECVFSKFNIANQIEKNDKNLNVINLGNSGIGPIIKLAILKEYAEPIKPKKIIWIYIEDNDLIDIQNEKKYKFLTNYLDINYSEKLIYRQEKIDRKIEKIVKPDIDIKKYSKKINYSLHTDKFNFKNFIKLKKLRSRFTGKNTYNIDFDTRYLDNKKILIETWKAAVDLANTWSGKIYFVYFPEYHVFPNVYHERSSEILKIAETIFHDVIDIKKEFLEKEDDKLQYFPYGIKNHFNEKGYEKISKIIYDKIK